MYIYIYVYIDIDIDMFVYIYMYIYVYICTYSAYSRGAVVLELGPWSNVVLVVRSV